MNDRKIVYLEVFIVIFALLSGILFFRLQSAKQEIAIAKTANEQIMGARQRTAQFFAHFVTAVLHGEANLDFEERLKLENEARTIGSPEILAKWQAFTASKTEATAQVSVVALLESIANELVTQ